MLTWYWKIKSTKIISGLRLNKIPEISRWTEKAIRLNKQAILRSYKLIRINFISKRHIFWEKRCCKTWLTCTEKKIFW